MPEETENLFAGVDQIRAGPEDRLDSGFAQEIIVLGRNHAAGDHFDVCPPGVS
jgi:hypothetical protein